MTSKLTPVTLPESGEVVLVERIGRSFALSFRRAYEAKYPKPRGPMFKTEMPDGQIVEQENTAHPDLPGLLREWQEKFSIDYSFFLMEAGVSIEWTEDRRESVKRKRELMASQGLESTESDKVFYLLSILGEKEQGFLVEAITRGMGPTEAGVQEQIANFRPDVSGEAPIQHPNGAIGVPLPV